MIIGEKPQNSEIQIVFVLLREATKKNFTTVVNYGGEVSKFWCANLKKVLFLELILQKHAVINS